MTKLNATTSHFIRCIKPNGNQKPGEFNGREVLVQLRYSGMCAALVLMQAGFPTRISFEDLYLRYAPKMPAMMAKLKPMTFSEALLVALDLHGGKDYQMGLTKIFFRAGKLAFMDDLTSNNAASVEGIVKKVRAWLARKRFYAAGYAIVSLNRLQKRIEGVRLVRRFRRAGRFMLRVVRAWLPMLKRARARLYSEEVMRARREAEEKRKRQEEEEQRRREEEEEVKRKAEEAERQRVEEERRRKQEEARRKEEDARRALEDKIQTLTNNNARMVAEIDTWSKSVAMLEQTLSAEKSIAESLTAQLEVANLTTATLEGKIVAMEGQAQRERDAMQQQLQQFTASVQGDKASLMAQMEQLIGEKQNVEKQMADLMTVRASLQGELKSCQGRLQDTQAALAKHKGEAEATIKALTDELASTKAAMGGKVAGLEQQLAAERQNAAQTFDDLQQAYDETERVKNELSTAKSDIKGLKSKIKAATDANTQLQDQLRAEKNGREDDNHAAKLQVDEMARKAASDIDVKDAIIATLRTEKKELENKVAGLKKLLAGKEDEFNNQIKAAEQRESEVAAELKETKQALTEMTAKAEKLEREKPTLIQKAFKCQEAQMKVKTKEEEKKKKKKSKKKKKKVDDFSLCLSVVFKCVLIYLFYFCFCVGLILYLTIPPSSFFHSFFHFLLHSCATSTTALPRRRILSNTFLATSRLPRWPSMQARSACC